MTHIVYIYIYAHLQFINNILIKETDDQHTTPCREVIKFQHALTAALQSVCLLKS